MQLFFLAFFMSFATDHAQAQDHSKRSGCQSKKCIIAVLKIASTSNIPEFMLESLYLARDAMLKANGYNSDPTEGKESDDNAGLARDWTKLSEKQKAFINDHPLIDVSKPLDKMIQDLYLGILKKIAIKSLLDPERCKISTPDLASKAQAVCGGAMRTVCDGTGDQRNIIDLSNGGSMECKTSIIGILPELLVKSVSAPNPNPQTPDAYDFGNPFLRISPGESTPTNEVKADGSERIVKLLGEAYTDTMAKAFFNLASLRYKYTKLPLHMRKMVNSIRKKKDFTTREVLREKLKGNLTDWFTEDEALQKLTTACLYRSNPVCKLAKDENLKFKNTTQYHEKLIAHVARKLSDDILSDKIVPKKSEAVRIALCDLFTNPAKNINYPYPGTQQYIDYTREKNSINRLHQNALESSRSEEVKQQTLNEMVFGAEKTGAIRAALRDETPNSDTILLLTPSLSTISEGHNLSANLNLACDTSELPLTDYEKNSRKIAEEQLIDSAILDAQTALQGYIGSMNNNAPGDAINKRDQVSYLKRKLNRMIQMAPESVGKSLLNHNAAGADLVCSVLQDSAFYVELENASINGIHFVTNVVGTLMMFSGFFEPEGLGVKWVGQYIADFLLAGIGSSALLETKVAIGAQWDLVNDKTAAFAADTPEDRVHFTYELVTARERWRTAVKELKGDLRALGKVAFVRFLRALKITEASNARTASERLKMIEQAEEDLAKELYSKNPLAVEQIEELKRENELIQNLLKNKQLKTETITKLSNRLAVNNKRIEYGSKAGKPNNELEKPTVPEIPTSNAVGSTNPPAALDAPATTAVIESKTGPPTSAQGTTDVDAIYKSFSNGGLANLRDPSQQRAFVAYLSVKFGNTGSYPVDLYEKVGSIAKVLNRYPDLKKEPFGSVSVEIHEADYPVTDELKSFLAEQKSSVSQIQANLYKINANSGYWRKMLFGEGKASKIIPPPPGASHQQISAYRLNKGKQEHEDNEKWLAYFNLKIPKSLRDILQDQNLQPELKAKELFLVLRRERESMRVGGKDISKVSQAMVDLIHTIGFYDTQVVSGLKSTDGLKILNSYREILNRRNQFAKTLNFKDYDDALTAIHTLGNSPSNTRTGVIESSLDQLQGKIIEKSKSLKENINVFLVRHLSRDESPFRGCLGQDCSTESYFTTAFDPDYHYFTLTDQFGFSEGQITVVLGEAKRGEITVKMAFLDKVQNIPDSNLAEVIEAVRLSMINKGYILAIPNDLGYETGISNHQTTRKLLADHIEKGRELLEFKKATPESVFFNRSFSRAGSRLASSEILPLSLPKSIVLRPNEPVLDWNTGIINMGAALEESYTLKSNQNLEQKMRYIPTMEQIIKGGLAPDRKFKSTVQEWIEQELIPIKIRKQAVVHEWLVNKKLLTLVMHSVFQGAREPLMQSILDTPSLVEEIVKKEENFAELIVFFRANLKIRKILIREFFKSEKIKSINDLLDSPTIDDHAKIKLLNAL